MQDIITDQYFIWVDGPSHGDYLVSASFKIPDGIKHINRRYKSPNLTVIQSEVNQYGTVSPRPFVVGQTCDGTGDACCHALYFHYCQSQGLDPIALYRRAYQVHNGKKYSDPDYEAIIEKAIWEGLEYPPEWNDASFKLLLKSLYSINNRSLVEVLEEVQSTLKHSNDSLSLPE